MSDLENDLDSDHEVSKDHSKLLEAVSKLSKSQRVKKPQRSEPSIQVSEFHLVKSGITDTDAVPLKDLLSTLQHNPSHRPITQKLKSLSHPSKVLPKPLERPQADRLKREVGFENTKKEIQKWDAIITRNRTAPTLSFPLTNGQVSFKGTRTDEFVKRFRVQSDLQKELESLEPEKSSETDQKDEFPLTLAEILERRRESAKFRAQQSYKEAKAHRQKKIKSKKFHRIARKAKIKQQIKDFEQLQKTDPEAALEKLEQLDKTRAEERMSLRHKSTGQWAKNKQVRAKYDTESRKVLAQQLAISRELTQKVRKDDDSDEDDEEAGVVDGGDNPWINSEKTSGEIDEFIMGYRKFWDEKNRVEKENKEKLKENDYKNEENDENGVNIEDVGVSEALNPVEDVLEEDQNSFNEDEDQNKRLKKKKSSESEELSDLSGKNKKKRVKQNELIDLSEKNSKKRVKNNELIDLSEENEKKNAKNKELIDLTEENSTKKTKLNGKTIKIKKSKAKFTSQWSVETFPTSESEESDQSFNKSFDIDELFDKMEDKLNEKLKEKVNKKGRRIKQKIKKLEKYEDDEDEEEKNSEEELPDLSFKNTRVRPEFNEALDETAGDKGNSGGGGGVKEGGGGVGVKRKAEIDPTKFISVKPKHLKTQVPDDVMGGEEAMDDSDGDEAQHNIISEAFADDDVVEEFRKEKEDEIKKSQPEDLDLRLPGWGSWTGKNIKPNLRKKRRFIMKFPKEAPRRDENKGDVIIMEDANTQIKKHLVAELPYPFTSVADYEASIRAPIGRDFVPENAHKRLTDPAVETKMGTIIEPMDEDVLVNKKDKIGGFVDDKNDKKQQGKFIKKRGIKQKKN